MRPSAPPTWPGARRIVVLGCAGAGKTTLARRLGQALSAPVFVLDDLWVRLQPAGDTQAFRDHLRDLHRAEAWVSDGNFAAVSFDVRLMSADVIIWLERPRWVCLWRAVTRVLRAGESHRPGDVLKVWRFIWGFDRNNRPKIEAERQAFGPDIPVLRVRGDRGIAGLLAAARTAA